jgi:hypothetical protein
MGKAAGPGRVEVSEERSARQRFRACRSAGSNRHPERSRLHVGGFINVWLFLPGCSHTAV